jgi:hypothetical protein
MRQRATNHARTNESDLIARHFGKSFAVKSVIDSLGIDHCRQSHRPKVKKWQLIIFGPAISIG